MKNRWGERIIVPLPKPSDDDNKEDWIERCMSNKQMVREFEPDQRRAVCEDRWKRRSEL